MSSRKWKEQKNPWLPPCSQLGFSRQLNMSHLCLFCEMTELDPMLWGNCFCSPKTKCPCNPTSSGRSSTERMSFTTNAGQSPGLPNVNGYWCPLCGSTGHIFKFYIYVYDLHGLPNRHSVKICCWTNEWMNNQYTRLNPSRAQASQSSVAGTEQPSCQILQNLDPPRCDGLKVSCVPMTHIVSTQTSALV